jgi:spore germination cell wall hydrolase CwlJ-like protein
MHLFALLLGAALLFLSAGLVFRMVQTQKRLELVQSQLHKVTEEAVQAKASDVESQEAVSNLRRELDKARQSLHRAEADAGAFSTQVASLKSELDRNYANRDVLQGELKLAHSEVTQVRSRLKRVEYQVVEMRLRLKDVQSDLEASEQAAAQAKTKATDLEEQAIQLQSKLEMGKAERDDLRKELQAQVALKASPLSKLSIDSEARDYLIRTIVFEGEGETEVAKAALAHVILNRQRIGRWGDKIKDVVMHPGQFEPWMTRRDEIEKFSAKDRRYQSAAELVDCVLTGRIPDPTAGATYFLNPVVVRQRRGGTLPGWAEGEGRPIGRHVFYSPHDGPQVARSRRHQPDKFQHPTGTG